MDIRGNLSFKCKEEKNIRTVVSEALSMVTDSIHCGTKFSSYAMERKCAVLLCKPLT